MVFFFSFLFFSFLFFSSFLLTPSTGIFQQWGIGGVEYGVIINAMYLKIAVSDFATLISCRTQVILFLFLFSFHSFFMAHFFCFFAHIFFFHRTNLSGTLSLTPSWELVLLLLSLLLF